MTSLRPAQATRGPIPRGALGLLLLVLPCAGGAGEKLSPDDQILKHGGVESDAVGLLRYLRQQQAGDVTDLVKELGNDAFATRVEATRRLKEVVLLVQAELEEAAKSEDAEVRQRAVELLSYADSDARPLLLAVLRTVKERRPAGAAPELVRMAGSIRDPFLRRQIRDTACAVARPEDEQALRAALVTGPAESRALALLALEKAIGDKALTAVRARLDDEDEVLRLAAVRALLAYAPRECLPRLAALLDARADPVRAESFGILRALTGQDLGYLPTAPVERRRAAAARWQEWARDQGPTATLRLPLREKGPVLGRTLVCFLTPARIEELDTAGKVVFRDDKVGSICGCQVLAGGRVLADWDNNELVQQDVGGKIVWRAKLPGTPNCLQALPDGTLLVGLFDVQEVCEVRRDGSVGWKVKVEGQPTDVHRLEDGRTLVALYGTNQVVEVNRAGKVLWRVEVASPESARRLANGNTLVACSRPEGKVVELTPAGKVVWSWKSSGPCYDALELENGNLLIGGGNGLVEVSRDGKVVREPLTGTVRRISRE